MPTNGYSVKICNLTCNTRRETKSKKSYTAEANKQNRWKKSVILVRYIFPLFFQIKQVGNQVYHFFRLISFAGGS
jgi:hypothetical protein